MAEREAPRDADELCDVVDRFDAMALDRDGRFPPGGDGDHAWMSILDRGFIFHAYFGGHSIRFELYGPTAPGQEREHIDPYDGSGLAGQLDSDALKTVIRLLEAGKSPRQHLIQNAIECSVVED